MSVWCYLNANEANLLKSSLSLRSDQQFETHSAVIIRFLSRDARKTKQTIPSDDLCLMLRWIMFHCKLNGISIRVRSRSLTQSTKFSKVMYNQTQFASSSLLEFHCACSQVTKENNFKPQKWKTTSCNITLVNWIHRPCVTTESRWTNVSRFFENGKIMRKAKKKAPMKITENYHWIVGLRAAAASSWLNTMETETLQHSLATASFHFYFHVCSEFRIDRSRNGEIWRWEACANRDLVFSRHHC